MARARKDPTDTRPRPSRAGIVCASAYEALIEVQLRKQARAEAAAKTENADKRREFRVKLTPREQAKVRAHVDRLVAAGLAASMESWVRDVVLTATQEGWIRRPGSVLVDGSLAPHGGLRGRE